MTVYSVYEPPGDEAGLEARIDKIAFVKEGFSWPALLVPALWLIYQRMWLELIVFLALIAALPLALGTDPEARDLTFWISFALTVLLAFEAGDLRGWSLQRRGYRFAGAASGRDRAEAERSFFTRWLPEQRPVRVPPPPVPVPSPRIVPARPSGGDDIIGSFPRA